MAMHLAIPLSMKNFQSLAVRLSPEVTVCVRGRHGIGKSQSVYQIASQLRSNFYRTAGNGEHTYEQGLPVVERRLSQMTEGDIVGLPFSDGRATQFKPCDWLIDACERPVVLFLDERNRALEGVKQAVFQLMDSKAFYGHKLHPETRIFIAENIGDQYTVNQVDPAELSRAAVIDLNPTTADWLAWASKNCHNATVEYIRANEGDLEYTGNFEPNKKYPDRRAWARCDRELVLSGLMETPEDTSFYHMAGAIIGVEAATKFWRFCKERDRDVSAVDILTGWAASKKRLGKNVPQERYIELVGKLGDWAKKNILTPDQAKEMAAFMHDAPGEARLACWAALHGTKNILILHAAPGMPELLTKTAMGAEAPKAAASKPVAAPKTKKSK